MELRRSFHTSYTAVHTPDTLGGGESRRLLCFRANLLLCRVNDCKRGTSRGNLTPDLTQLVPVQSIMESQYHPKRHYCYKCNNPNHESKGGRHFEAYPE